MMVTNTVFRKSNLEDLFLKKVIPVTSNHCPYHTDLLVSCLKFSLWLVCEYPNYYYNITNDYWAIPEKIQEVEFEDILFWKKNPEYFRFITLPLKILDKSKRIPWNCVTSFALEIPRPKIKTYGNSTYFPDQSWKLHFFFS